MIVCVQKEDQDFKQHIKALLTAYMPTDNYSVRTNQLQYF